MRTFSGDFGIPQAERLLWRAGFGPRPGDAGKLAAKGLRSAVLSLTRPGQERLEGPGPTVEGHPLAPTDAWGHDHLWWLDRMIRSNRQLVERMTLNWHDWFATSNRGVGSQKLMLDQNETLRANALGSFQDLLLALTVDPAMLHWLNGDQNTRLAPNENRRLLAAQESLLPGHSCQKVAGGRRGQGSPKATSGASVPLTPPNACDTWSTTNVALYDPVPARDRSATGSVLGPPPVHRKARSRPTNEQAPGPGAVTGRSLRRAVHRLPSVRVADRPVVAQDKESRHLRRKSWPRRAKS